MTELCVATTPSADSASRRAPAGPAPLFGSKCLPVLKSTISRPPSSVLVDRVDAAPDDPAVLLQRERQLDHRLARRERRELALAVAELLEASPASRPITTRVRSTSPRLVELVLVGVTARCPGSSLRSSGAPRSRAAGADVGRSGSGRTRSHAVRSPVLQTHVRGGRDDVGDLRLGRRLGSIACSDHLEVLRVRGDQLLGRRARSPFSPSISESTVDRTVRRPRRRRSPILREQRVVETGTRPRAATRDGPPSHRTSGSRPGTRRGARPRPDPASTSRRGRSRTATAPSAVLSRPYHHDAVTARRCFARVSAT